MKSGRAFSVIQASDHSGLGHDGNSKSGRRRGLRTHFEEGVKRISRQSGCKERKSDIKNGSVLSHWRVELPSTELGKSAVEADLW